MLKTFKLEYVPFGVGGPVFIYEAFMTGLKRT